jgi:hypothetical protein
MNVHAAINFLLFQASKASIKCRYISNTLHKLKFIEQIIRNCNLILKQPFGLFSSEAQSLSSVLPAVFLGQHFEL